MLRRFTIAILLNGNDGTVATVFHLARKKCRTDGVRGDQHARSNVVEIELFVFDS